VSLLEDREGLVKIEQIYGPVRVFKSSSFKEPYGLFSLLSQQTLLAGLPHTEYNVKS
jgi:hypothetical protein